MFAEHLKRREVSCTAAHLADLAFDAASPKCVKHVFFFFFS
jgi:hypothetical protein